MNILLLLFLSWAFAEPINMRDLMEKSYIRDSTYCELGQERTQIQIRTMNHKSDPGDQKYGEYVFYFPNVMPKLFDLNRDHFSTYRLVHGESSICTKTLGFKVGPNHVAIVLLRENNPEKDKLTLQLFNTSTFSPEDALETNYQIETIKSFEDGLIFNSFPERRGLDMGKITIQDVPTTYQDRGFPQWIKYNFKNGFTVVPEMTFEKFELKHHFQDLKEFKLVTGWDEKDKKFKKTILYVAVNHGVKKECILFSEEKIKVTGAEADWRCR